MINKTNEINSLSELLILESFLNNNEIVKNAQVSEFISTIIEHAKNYFTAHVDPKDPTGSVINLIAPGAVAGIFRMFNFKWTGLLIGLLMNVLHVDVAGIVRSFVSGLKPLASSGKVSQSDVEGIAQSLKQQYTPATTASYNPSVKDIRMLKLALVEYEASLIKTAGPGFNRGLLSKVSGGTAVSIFVSIIKWIFITLLSAGGLLVGGDVINKIVGRPNAFDKTLYHGKETGTGTATSQRVIPTQTKFKINPSYKDIQRNTNDEDDWFERAVNNRSGVETLVLNYAKTVYSGLENLDQKIRQSPGFNAVVKNILDYNIKSQGDVIVFIPPNFKSKKDIVDHFIDDVAV